MKVLDCTLMVEGDFGLATAEYCEGLPTLTENLDKAVIHLVKQLLNRIDAMKAENPTGYSIYLEVGELNKFEMAREAWIKWRQNYPKREPVLWQTERKPREVDIQSALDYGKTADQHLRGGQEGGDHHGE